MLGEAYAIDDNEEAAISVASPAIRRYVSSCKGRRTAHPPTPAPFLLRSLSARSQCYTHQNILRQQAPKERRPFLPHQPRVWEKRASMPLTSRRFYEGLGVFYRSGKWPPCGHLSSILIIEDGESLSWIITQLKRDPIGCAAAAPLSRATPWQVYYMYGRLCEDRDGARERDRCQATGPTRHTSRTSPGCSRRFRNC